MDNLKGYCGIDCKSCKLYQATITENQELKSTLAEDWGKNYSIKLELNNMICLGCKSDVVFKLCEECDIKKCCSCKGIQSCYECPQYKCSRLKRFIEYQEIESTGIKYYE